MMDEIPADTRYSLKTRIVESPTTSPFMRMLLCTSITLQLLSGIGLFLLGLYSFTLCDANNMDDFAGITALISVSYCLLLIGVSIFVCKQMRMLSRILCVITFVIAAFMVVYESAVYRCTDPSSATYVTGICVGLRTSSLNGCRWIHSTDTVGTDHSTEHHWREGRLAMSILAGICLTCNIATLIFVFLAIKLGKPVYLAMKRHKCSIIVGQAENADDALANRTKNLDFIVARFEEEEAYNRKRRDRLREYFSNRKRNEPVQSSRSQNSTMKERISSYLRSKPTSDAEVKQSRRSRENSAFEGGRGFSRQSQIKSEAAISSEKGKSSRV